jgi:hypothetical protein
MVNWIAFAFGVLLNTARQAKLVAGCDPLKNGINSMFYWFYRNLIGLLSRWAFATALWALLTANPHLLKDISLSIIGINATVSVPVEYGIFHFMGGGAMDLLGDFIVEKLPWLKKLFPPLGE